MGWKSLRQTDEETGRAGREKRQCFCLSCLLDKQNPEPVPHPSTAHVPKATSHWWEEISYQQTLHFKDITTYIMTSKEKYLINSKYDLLDYKTDSFNIFICILNFNSVGLNTYILHILPAYIKVLSNKKT